MNPAKTCRQCSAEVALTRLPPVQGEGAGIRVEIDGLPAYACARGHRRFLSADFPRRLIEELLSADRSSVAAPHAVKKGLFRKHYHCPGCGGELPREASTHASARHRIDIGESAPFEAGLTLPVYRCPSCARDAVQPRDEVQNGLMEAAANAFRAAGVPPG